MSAAVWRMGRIGLAMLIAGMTVAPSEWVSAQSTGESRLNLRALMDEALLANPDLLAARKRWEGTRAKVKQATGLPAPKIGVEFEEIPRGKVKINQATIMYQLIQALPFPGKLSLRKQVALLESQMAAMAYKQAEWELSRDVKSVYYDLFLVDRQTEIAEEQLLWLRQAERAARARYATESAGQGEVLQAQAEVLGAENQLVVLVHRRAVLVAHLNHLVNRPIESPLGTPEMLSLTPLSLTPAELALLAADRQPELLAFKYSAERAEAAWRLAKQELWPDLETMLELRDPAMGPIGPWDLSLAIVLPFWFWTKQQYGVKGALHDKESAKAAFAGAEKETERRIAEHWHEAWAAYRTAKLSKEGLIPLGQQAVVSQLAAYQAGRGSLFELVMALRQLSERQRAYDEALVSLEQHTAMLEQAAGVSFAELGG